MKEEVHDVPKPVDQKSGTRSYRNNDHSLDLYLQEIGETPLISFDEERRLARRIKMGDAKALEKLMKANLRFVVSVAKQYQHQGLPLSDLIGEGNIGLMKAAQRFDESRGFKFITYAVFWIRQTILQALIEQSRIVRLPYRLVRDRYKVNQVSAQLEQFLGREPSSEEVAAALELTEADVEESEKIWNSHASLDAPFINGGNDGLLDVLEDQTSPAADETMHKQELREYIEKILDSLTPREAEVIDLYFGFTEPVPLTLEQIGARFALSRERVRQIRDKAICRLRVTARSKPLRDYYFDNSSAP